MGGVRQEVGEAGELWGPLQGMRPEYEGGAVMGEVPGVFLSGAEGSAQRWAAP